jgi:hypothetical protein
MGADLIGYMAVGPTRLPDTPEALAAAVAVATERQQKVALAFADGESVDSVRIDGSYYEAYDAENIAALDPVALVEAFVDLWNEGRARDVCWRELPTDPPTKCLFAGDMSWGEEPEGHGYTTLRDADRLGLWHFYGLK